VGIATLDAEAAPAPAVEDTTAGDVLAPTSETSAGAAAADTTEPTPGHGEPDAES
jgi:hypothetical protein